nr:hypothetical protein [uncultured Schaedlerella sp.]
MSGRRFTGHTDPRSRQAGGPYLFQDEFQVYFGCVAAENGHCLIGPMSVDFFDRLKRHRFCRHYGIPEHAEKNLRRFTLMEVLQIMCIAAKIVTGREYTDQEVVDANRMAVVTKEQEVKDQIRFHIQSEEEDIFRHSYQEEREILDMVRAGNVTEAVRLTKKIDVEIGRMGRSELAHLRNLLTVGISLRARAAIEGGVSPYAAYRISGFYTNKGAECTDTTQILVYRNHAVEELTNQVRTIYDEAWSDCDHNYVYKQDENKSHTALEQMSFLLCQLTNFSNDFGECMRDIFENEAMEETDQNQWIASEEIYDVMEDSLIRIKDIYTQMEAFQNRLVKESVGGKHGSEV